MSRVTISITKDDLMNGVPHSGTHDPLCLAARRVIPAKSLTDTPWELLWVDLEGVHHEVPLPTFVTNWILQYDLGVPMRPISFAVTIE